MRKFLPYILILVVLVGTGFFGPTEKASAYQVGQACTITVDGEKVNGAYVEGVSGREGSSLKCEPGATPTIAPTPVDIKEELGGSCAIITEGFDACLVKITYVFFFTVPTYLAILAGKFFNIMINLGLQSSMYSADFIPQAWRITRDLSNIFFILILLYVAIKIILGLAGHDGKKIIIWVIIMALLINFSMFASKVVIDSSNVLALIFYNKINVEAKDATGHRDYLASVEDEKDFSGGLISKFDVTKWMTADFFKALKEKSQVAGPSTLGFMTSVGLGAAVGSFIPIVGTGVGAVAGATISVGGSVIGWFIGGEEIPFGTKIAIILTAGLILYFAVYAFFMAGLAFIKRLVELWILIIFSPFAFMSFAMPALKKVKYIGWDDWSHRLLSVSFMATIFMFFMYFIFLIAQTDLFSAHSLREKDFQSSIELVIFVVLPALVLLLLLRKATDYAKKGAGELGTWAMKGVKLAGGLALAAGTAGTAIGLRNTVGRGAAAIQESKGFRDFASKAGGAGRLASWGLGLASSNSFDLRNAPGAGGLAKIAGVNINAGKAIGLGPKEGGFIKAREEGVKQETEYVKNRLDVSDAEFAQMVEDYGLVEARRLKWEINATRRAYYVKSTLGIRTTANAITRSKIQKSAEELHEEAQISHAFHEIAQHIEHETPHAPAAPHEERHEAPATEDHSPEGGGGTGHG